MGGACCTGEGRQRRLAGRLSGVAGTMLPGAGLVLLPKCPLCLAAWLTMVTGFSIPAAAASIARGIILIFWIAAAVLGVWQMVRRRRGRERPAGIRPL